MFIILCPVFFFATFDVGGMPMDRTLKEHISELQRKQQELNRQIMENARTHVERNRIESEIRAAELAITYYKKALELEGQVR